MGWMLMHPLKEVRAYGNFWKMECEFFLDVKGKGEKEKSEKGRGKKKGKELIEYCDEY